MSRVNEERSFDSFGIFHEFFIQMNLVSFGGVQASSCLVCVQSFLKRPAMKSALVLDWAPNMHSSSDDIIFMGYKSGHTLHCFTEKKETSRLFTCESVEIKLSIIFHRVYSLRCFAKRQHPAFCCGVQYVYIFFNFKVFSCDCIMFFPSAVTSVCL